MLSNHLLDNKPLEDINRLDPNTLFKQLQYEKLLSRISVRAVEKIHLDEYLDFSLAEMGRTLGVSRSYIFENDHNSGILTNTYEWCAEGIIPKKDELQAIPTIEFNLLIDILYSNTRHKSSRSTNIFNHSLSFRSCHSQKSSR